MPTTRLSERVELGPAADLAARIENGTARVGVVGLGYVGLPLVQMYCGAGFATVGFDIDASKVKLLQSGQSYINHIPSDTIQTLRDGGRFEATADFQRLSEMDVIIICVPTPLSRHREPDLSAIVKTGQAISHRLRPGQLVVLESSTFPGTTDEILKPILEQSGLEAGQDFFLAYSPEREDPGNQIHSARTTPKVVGADGPEAQALTVALYDKIVCKTIPVSNSRTAEAVKLTENIFRSVNIALVNELKIIFTEMGVDIWEVIEAAKSKPFGFMPFYPGPGLGGHCIPIDPFYLTWKAREFDVPTRFIELAGEINNSMPMYVVTRLADAMNMQMGKALHGSHILMIGVAYKKDVDDMRESPSLVLIEQLERRGAKVDFHDPYIPIIPHTRQHDALSSRRSVDLTPDGLAVYDAVVISTDHSNVDYEMLSRHSKLIVDTRNAAVYGIEGAAHIVKA